MKIVRLLKAVLVGFTGLFIIITLFSLLIPSNVKVSRATVINNVTTAQVYDQVAQLGNWRNWHPVFKADSVTISFSDTSKKACTIIYNGTVADLAITSRSTDDVQFKLSSNGENDIANQIVITGIPAQEAVQVEWRAITKLHWYPWEKFYGIFIDKLSGPGYEAALEGLKNFLEEK